MLFKDVSVFKNIKPKENFYFIPPILITIYANIVTNVAFYFS